MKKFLLQIAGLALLTGLLFTTSCTEDGTVDPGGGSDIPPLMSLVSEIDFVSSDAEVEAGSTFGVKLRLQTGTNTLRSLKITEDNTTLPTNRFTINGGAITANNPFLITGASKSGATYEIDIKVHDGFEVTKTYTFEVTDDNSLTDAVSLEITTSKQPGTPVTEITGALLNQSGPAGQGGLDLDTGESVGSRMTSTGNPAVDTSYLRAEINDEGNISMTSQQWKQQISAVQSNGASMKYPGDNMPEGFSYEGVQTKEQIQAAYEVGKEFTESDGTELISDPVKVGDVFLVKRGDRYYVIKVMSINVTDNDNKDSYEFSIKY